MRVETAAREELAVIPHLGHAPVLHHDDPIRPAHDIRTRHHRRRSQVERLEERTLLASFLVTTAADNGKSTQT